MKQRHNECLLASVCAVTGTDYPTASDLYHEIYGVPWGDINPEHRMWLVCVQCVPQA